MCVCVCSFLFGSTVNNPTIHFHNNWMIILQKVWSRKWHHSAINVSSRIVSWSLRVAPLVVTFPLPTTWPSARISVDVAMLPVWVLRGMDRLRHMKTWATLWDTWQQCLEVKLGYAWQVGCLRHRINLTLMDVLFLNFIGSIPQIGCTRNHPEAYTYVHALWTSYLLEDFCWEIFALHWHCFLACVCVCAFALIFHSYGSDSSNSSCSRLSDFSPQKNEYYFVGFSSVAAFLSRRCLASGFLLGDALPLMVNHN